MTVDGSPGVGSYGVDLGGPVFGTKVYTFRENTNGFGSYKVKLDVTDPDNDPVTGFSIVGGADYNNNIYISSQGYLEINYSARNFEDPKDANGDSIYELRVRAQTSDGNYTEQDITLEVIDDGKSQSSEWFNSNTDTPKWLSFTDIDYIVGQGSYQIPLEYYVYNLNTTTLTGSDSKLFQMNYDRINFKVQPSSKSSVQDANGDGIFEFTLNFQDQRANAVSKDFKITLLDNAIDADGMELDGGLGDDTLSFAYPSLSSLSDIDVLLYKNSSGITKSGGEFILVDQKGGIVSFRNFETVKVNNQEFDINYGETNYNLKSVFYSATEKTALLYSHRTDVTYDVRDNAGESRLNVQSLQSKYHNNAATDFTIIGSAQQDNIEAYSSYNSNTDTFNLGLLNINTKEGNDTVDARGGKAHSIDLGAGDDNVKLYLDDILSGYLITKAKLDGGTGSDTIDFSSSGTGYFNKTAPTLSKTSFTWLESNQISDWGKVTLVRYLSDDQSSAKFTIVGGSDADDFYIDTWAGNLRFKNNPDFESPKDANSNNTYEVKVAVSDQRGQTSNIDIKIDILDQDENFTGVRLFQKKTVYEVPETSHWDSAVYVVPIELEASKQVYLDISGADANLFQDYTDRVQFKERMDFETPKDANGDNVYEITLTYKQRDASNNIVEVGSDDIQIKITDIDESSSSGITYILNDGVAENFET